MDKENITRTFDNDEKKIIEAAATKIHLTQAHEVKQEQNLRIESEIELAREYTSTGLWHGALKTLKKLLQNQNLSTDQEGRVSKLFIEAQAEMKQAEILHPNEVKRFEQFNLPIDNVS